MQPVEMLCPLCDCPVILDEEQAKTTNQNPTCPGCGVEFDILDKGEDDE